MVMLQGFRPLAFLLVLVFVSGCSGNGRSRVYGTVKYKGEPVKAGQISFILEGSETPSGGAAITNGAYEVPAVAGLAAGKYKVSISSLDTKGAPAPTEAPGVSGPPPKELMPAEYNANTKLTAEVKAGGSNKFDYDLK